jgi:DNA-binding transcriptional MocR family regulator
MIYDSTTELGATRLIGHLRHEIARRRPGDQLPSTRQLVETHRVSPVTVSRTLATLTAEGLVVTRPGAGSYVAQPRASRAPIDHSWQTLALGPRPLEDLAMTPVSSPGDEDAISLALGYLHPSLMPTRALSAALARAARLPDAWEVPPPGGLHGLRTWFAKTAGAGIDPADVVIAPGGQGAISTILRAVVPSGEPLLVESPTYPGALAVARGAGIRVVPVPIDNDGIVPEALADAFARTGARALYCQPTYQNPTGRVLAPQRRAAVLEIAAAAGAFVIEDDFARWLVHDTPPPGSLLADDSDGRVIYITSLTKPVSPSLRIGAVIGRGPVAVRIKAMRLVDDMFVGRPVQEAALDLVSGPGWDRHRRFLAGALSSRSRALTHAVAQHLPAVDAGIRPHGGMHLWVRLPAGVDDVAVAEAARRHAVTITPGRGYFPAEAPDPYLRLTFSAAATEADLAVGVQRLAEAAPALVG